MIAPQSAVRPYSDIVSNSQAFPIARVPQREEAYQIALRLLGLADSPGGIFDFYGITDTHAGLSRYTTALPGAVLTIFE